MSENALPLRQRIDKTFEQPSQTEAGCMLCPRRCLAQRSLENGFCGAGSNLRAARAGLHLWEEPCISGTRGSGTVFLSGCPLRCCFCQNHDISLENKGKTLTVQRLGEIFLELEDEGAHTLNLVSPTPYIPQIREALSRTKEKRSIPVVYNTGGYERVESLKLLEGFVDVYLPDLKFKSPELSARYARANDYFDMASRAILEMYRQTGPVVFNDEGIMLRGVLIRHLVLPGAYRDSFDVLGWIKENFPPDSIQISLMSQYTPGYQNQPFPELNRRLTSFEYNKAAEYALSLGLNGYVQEKSSAKKSYTPSFQMEGL